MGVAALATEASVLAADTSSGCGLGWQVTQRQSLVSSSVRNTTNYFLPNTFSMTSGTSGCAKHELVKNDENAVKFAVNNYDSLVVEMSKGRGEFLNGFAQALGCTDSAEFGAFVQDHYETILNESSDGGISLYRAVRTQLQTSPLATRCLPTA